MMMNFKSQAFFGFSLSLKIFFKVIECIHFRICDWPNCWFLVRDYLNCMTKMK